MQGKEKLTGLLKQADKLLSKGRRKKNSLII
jgi:hypothetical protein